MRNNIKIRKNRHRNIALLVVGLFLTLTLLSGLPIEQWWAQHMHKLSATHEKIVGDVNPQLAQKLTYNAEKEAFQFNSEAQPVDEDIDPSEMTAEKLRHIAGSEEEQSKLYSLDVARDGNKGITFYDTNLKLSFTLKPEFDVGRGYELDDRLVYPMEGAKAVYTVKGNGLKEDILYDTAPRDGRATHTYSLDLPKELEARLHDDGSVGIYSADPVLFGNMSFGGEGDKLKIISARQTANKDHLVFSVPKPIIVTESGETDEAKAWFELNDTTLTLNARDLNAIDGPFSIDPTVVVTSSSDFQEGGNNEYNTGFGTDEIYREGLSGGSVGAWQNGGFDVRRYHASVVSNGYLYVIGGYDGSNRFNDVQYAPVNDNGRVGSWSSTTSFTTARYGHTSVAHNGYLYITGGNGGGQLNDVQYAPINADGTVGAWSTTTSFSAARRHHASVVSNDYLYVIGGYDGGYRNDVQYAPINADGTVGAWSTTTSFSTARDGHTSVAHNGYLYVIGGWDNSHLNDVQYAPLNADGTVGTWSTTTSFNAARRHHTSVVHNGYLYVIGGYDGGYLDDTQYAPINADGTVGTWSTTTSFNMARYGHTSVAHNGYLYVIGGYDGNDSLNDTQYAPINADGTVGSWSIATSFTNGRNNHASVVYNGYLYVIGGYDSSDRVNDVQYAPINDDGTVGTWNTTTSFPTARDSHAAVAYNGYLYVIGGYDVSSLSYLSDVQYAPINADGTVGSWAATTSFTTARGSHTSVVYNGYLYVIGGKDLNDVQYAPINVDGTVGSWAATTSFTTGRHSHASVVYNGYLYVIGGNSSGNSYLSDVQYAPINADGTVGSWTATTSFTNGRNSHASVVHNGYLYVIGGYDSSNLSDVQYAPINADGTVGSWATTTSFVGDHYRHASVVYNGYLYVIGGRGSSSNYLSDVLYSKIDLPGVTTNYSATTDLPEYSYSCGLLCTANSRTLAGHTSVAYNGYIYILGGSREDDGSRVTTNTVYYAPVNNNGSLGSWSSTSSFTTGRYDHTSVAHDGYLYILGGFDGSGYTNDVQYAPINSDGTVGSWNTTTSFTTPRLHHASVAYNGYLYVLGGFTNNIVNDVQYAPINSDGTVGSWNTTTSFNTERRHHTSVVANGHLYVIGGDDGSVSPLNDIEYAPINANGTVGSWNTTTSFTTAREEHTSVAYNGYLYVIGGSGGSTLNDVQYAPINANGTVGSWSTTASFTTARERHTSVVYNGHLYVVGGYDGSNYLDDVQFAQINNGGPGTTDTYGATSSFTTGRSRHASVVYNDYIYVLGGYDGSRFNDVQYAPLNADGTVGSWSATTSFNTARYWHTANVHDGYLYVLGGSSSSGAINDVQYAPLNADGTVGSWSTTTSFNTARYGHTSVIYNDYIYVLGGGSYRSDVQSAPINADGTLGSWSSTVSFNTGRRWHASVFSGDYLYILGGYDGSNYLDEVEYAPINVDGTVGSWSTTTSFSGVRQQLDAVVVNGYIYISGGTDASSRLNDVQYASIESGGALGVWKDATSFSNVRGDHASAYANGFHYILGGYDGSSYFSDVQYVPVNVIARKARYSKLIDLGGERTITDITSNRADGNEVEIYYRVAGEDAVFGALNPAFTLDGTCSTGDLGRYVHVTIVIDDAQYGVFPDTKLGTITDFTVHYETSGDAVPTDKRLHQGKYFDQQVLQPLDTLKTEGAGSC